MEILKIRHNWPERAGFTINRPQGAKTYILLHFQSPVELWFDRKRHDVRPGAFIIFAPGTAHRFISHGALLHDWMHLMGSVEEALAQVDLRVDTLYQTTCGAEITKLTARLEAEFFAQRKHWAPHRDALLMQLFVLISYNLSGEETPRVPRATADRLRELRSQMLLNPGENWSNERMARYVSLSVSRLYPLYRRMFAISPNRDLILIRIEKAKTMLDQGATVAETADEMGYASTCHFSRQFKQFVGVSPGKYGGKRSP